MWALKGLVGPRPTNLKRRSGPAQGQHGLRRTRIGFWAWGPFGILQRARTVCLAFACVCFLRVRLSPRSRTHVRVKTALSPKHAQAHSVVEIALWSADVYGCFGSRFPCLNSSVWLSVIKPLFPCLLSSRLRSSIAPWLNRKHAYSFLQLPLYALQVSRRTLELPLDSQAAMSSASFYGV